jgi:hypothetical protein
MRLRRNFRIFEDWALRGVVLTATPRSARKPSARRAGAGGGT